MFSKLRNFELIVSTAQLVSQNLVKVRSLEYTWDVSWHDMRCFLAKHLKKGLMIRKLSKVHCCSYFDNVILSPKETKWLVMHMWKVALDIRKINIKVYFSWKHTKNVQIWCGTFYPLWISLIHLTIFTIAINKESDREQTFSKPNYMKDYCIFSVLIIELQISKKPKNVRKRYIWWKKDIYFLYMWTSTRSEKYPLSP